MLPIRIRVALLALSLVAAPAHAGFLFFNSRFDDFKALVDSGNLEGAAALYEKEKAYFSERKGDEQKFVDDVLGQRDGRYRKELTVARLRLRLADQEEGQMMRWHLLKESLTETEALLSRDAALPAMGPMTINSMTRLRDESDHVKAKLMDAAPQALLDYGLFNEPSFAEQYPVAIVWASHPELSALVEAQLATATTRQLEWCKKMYGETLISALGLGGKLSDLYVNARLSELNANSYFARRLVRERLAKEGWKPSGKKGSNVLIAAWPAPSSDVSTLRIASPTTVDYVSLDAAKTPEKFITDGGVGSHELVVFVRPARIQLLQKESNSRQIGSQYQSGSRRVPNPAFAQARRDLARAEESLSSIRRASANTSSDTSSTLGILSTLVSGVSEAAAESDVSDARQTLASTPQMIDEVVLSSYSYPAKTVSVRQSVAIRYAIYDVGTGKVSTGSTERSWSKAFEVADQIHPNDPDRASIIKATKTSQYVLDWIKAPIDDKYEEIWKSIYQEYSQANWGL